MFSSDPDAAVYLAFRSHIRQSLGTLRKIDQAKDVISASGESAERKRAAIAALDKARAEEVLKADKLDRAVDLIQLALEDKAQTLSLPPEALGPARGLARYRGQPADMRPPADLTDTQPSS